jgi:hypothetical protein
MPYSTDQALDVCQAFAVACDDLTKFVALAPHTSFNPFDNGLNAQVDWFGIRLSPIMSRVLQNAHKLRQIIYEWKLEWADGADEAEDGELGSGLDDLILRNETVDLDVNPFDVAVISKSVRECEVVQRAANWRARNSTAGQTVPQDAATTTAATDSMMSAADLAKHFGVNPDRLRKQLERWRAARADGYIENTEAGRNEPRWMYRLADVSPMIISMKTEH